MRYLRKREKREGDCEILWESEPPSIFTFNVRTKKKYRFHQRNSFFYVVLIERGGT